MADVGVRLFYYLIRIVVFFNRYRSPDCCKVLSGKVFLQFFVVVTYLVILSAVFSFLVVGIVLQRGCVYLLLDVDTVDVCTFCWMLTLWMCVLSAGC